MLSQSESWQKEIIGRGNKMNVRRNDSLVPGEEKLIFS